MATQPGYAPLALADPLSEEAAALSKRLEKEAPFEYCWDDSKWGDSNWESTQWEQASEILQSFEDEQTEVEKRATHAGGSREDADILERCKTDIAKLRQCWDVVHSIETTFKVINDIRWDAVDMRTGESLCETLCTVECRKLTDEVKALGWNTEDKHVKEWGVYHGCDDAVTTTMKILLMLKELRSSDMRERHWEALQTITGGQDLKSHYDDTSTTLGTMLQLGLHKYHEAMQEIILRARKEPSIEHGLRRVKEEWSGGRWELAFSPYKQTKSLLVNPELVATLKDNVLVCKSMKASRYVAFCEEEVTAWHDKLSAVDEIIGCWQDVQKKWEELEPLFQPDVRDQLLPEICTEFDGIDADWKRMMEEMCEITNPIEAARKKDFHADLKELKRGLEQCRQSVNNCLETKRRKFPRFYFIPTTDFLDIVSKGGRPWELQKYFSQIFDAVDQVRFEANKDGTSSKTARAMIDGTGEVMNFHKSPFVLCDGPVEDWLNIMINGMRDSLRHLQVTALKHLATTPRHQWALQQIAQITVLVSRIVYTADVETALTKGDANALKDCYDKHQMHLNHLSDLINAEGLLTTGEHKKIVTLMTIDVHARDVIHKLNNDNVETKTCFQWKSQLRYYIDKDTSDCRARLCDFSQPYNYEYIGNCGTLVITPLTDRCYITLTLAVRLGLGGAPTGPAGTGKTETTRDLGRALGIMVYRFNCSDQWDYRVMANVFKGLAQTGCWGCFDEFNRITIEVLSVCSQQYKRVLDGIRTRSKEIQFDDECIKIVGTAMAVITMNPVNSKYAGRTELPESLKVLFRPVAMVVPNKILIAEVMLYAMGFVSCKVLTRKLMLCYTLSQDLLSKKGHYDWTLRAVKATLCVAGSMKRAAPELSEDVVLGRVLRDFTAGKLSRHDIDLFTDLLNDLFPKHLRLVPRARDMDFEEAVRECAAVKGLQAENGFVEKTTQLREIFGLRWSVFLIGVPGSGKTRIWEILMDAQNKRGENGMAKALNPKAVTCDELYGTTLANGAWKDGLLSQIYRDFSSDNAYKHLWIVCDGDIDAKWIETMNTVMDDNKLLALANGERIALTPPMRLLFEVAEVHNASPATISRAGVIFVREDDIGWRPFVSTWLDSRPSVRQQEQLRALVSIYVPPTLSVVLKRFTQAVPMMQISGVMTLCHLLDGLLGVGDDAKQGLSEGTVETYFVWATVWAFGGSLLVDKATNYKEQFSQWWLETFKVVRFPAGLTVFDVMVDQNTDALVPWVCEDCLHTRGKLLHRLHVDVPETSRLNQLFKLLAVNHHRIMYVGNSGTGKTACMRNSIKTLGDHDLLRKFIDLNFQVDSLTLQTIMEEQLRAQTSIVLAPPDDKYIIYCIDDLHIPRVDKYNTQEPIAFLRFLVDYDMTYDREMLRPRKVKKCDIVATMNPSSFIIDGRFQRQFATFSCEPPPGPSLRKIYGSILKLHLSDSQSEIADICQSLVRTACELHVSVMDAFLPSAVKFHYIFNMRDISNVFGGLLRGSEALPCSVAGLAMQPKALVKLLIHEQNRVYRDRLINIEDMKRYDSMHAEIFRKHLAAIDGCTDCFMYLRETDGCQGSIESPLIFTDFCTNPSEIDQLGRLYSVRDKPYLAVEDWQQLNAVLEDQLKSHNETQAVMNIVLFSDALEHVARISRIIGQPRGNALLVGVGGCGKQSLARLAAWVNDYEVFQIQVWALYNFESFKNDIRSVYKRAGLQNIGILFLFTDQQILDEKMLVVLNQMLSSGDVHGLFSAEHMDEIVDTIRSKVQQAGIVDTRDSCWEFYIENTRKYLHTALCFSPVGDALRVRARRFPALLSGTSIDWFHSWSPAALVAVARRYIRTELVDMREGLQEGLAEQMSRIHKSAQENCKQYYVTHRRWCYMTPKSFLEMLALYTTMLRKKLEENDFDLTKLQTALDMVVRLHKGAAELAKSSENSAVEEQDAAISQAAKTTAKKYDLANRLVNVLSSERGRWDQSIESCRKRKETLIGDVMIAAAFVSYIGAFTAEYREKLAREWNSSVDEWNSSTDTKRIPITNGVQPIEILANASEIASWGKEGLPRDLLSVQNGAIVHNSARWPLLIDPQLQGIKWIKRRHLTIEQMSQLNMDRIEAAIFNGECIVIANMGEQVDHSLDAVLARSLQNQGDRTIIRLGDRDVHYHDKFQLYLQTTLANPHYIPEVQAQCTLVNFTVSEEGLENQLLLALIMESQGRPDLASREVELGCAQSDFEEQLQVLDDELLTCLANAEGVVLEPTMLVEKLEHIKAIKAIKGKSAEIRKKIDEVKQPAKPVDEARESYRPIAARASLMYSLVSRLNDLSHMYQFSWECFVDIVKKGMEHTPDRGDLLARIDSMVDETSFRVYSYVASGLFERHKLIFAAQLCFKIGMSEHSHSEARSEFQKKVEYLLRAPRDLDPPNSVVEWLSGDCWAACCELEKQLGGNFQGLADAIQQDPIQWQRWHEAPRAEIEPLPGARWQEPPSLDQLLLIRCMRPDRIVEAVRSFVAKQIGEKYVTSQPFDLEKSFRDSRPDVPIFFILSPGVDVMAPMEALHRKICDKGPKGAVNSPIKFVALGQGQEPVANTAIEKARKEGGWVALQNIHLSPGFCKRDLEPLLQNFVEDACIHKDFRLMLSAEPSSAMPILILQACVKLTNEPPDGMDANIKRCLSYVTDYKVEHCSSLSKQATSTFDKITFALCYFHAVLLQRQKFGSIGWNHGYSFTRDDLESSTKVCFDYLEDSSSVPWSGIRYLVGEVIYGGRVSDDWDRKLINTYLETWLRDDLLDDNISAIEDSPGCASPSPLTVNYNEYINSNTHVPLPTHACCGLHSNSEIELRQVQASRIFASIGTLQPRTSGGSPDTQVEVKAKQSLDYILEKLPGTFDFEEINERLMLTGDKGTPFAVFFLQEIERMNALLSLMKSSLRELDLCLAGELVMPDAMEDLMDSLYRDTIPPAWEKRSYPTLRSLSPWFSNVQQRYKQLEVWSRDLTLPKVSWFPGFFRPQSFLVAVMQTWARRNEWPLDKTVVQTEMTNIRDQVESASSVHRHSLQEGNQSVLERRVVDDGLNWLCTSGQLNGNILKFAVENEAKRSRVSFADTWTRRDGQQQTPLHKLCANKYISAEAIKVANQHAPALCWSTKDAAGMTPLHAICNNQPAGLQRLEGVLSAANIPVGAWIVQRGTTTSSSRDTPLHLLLMQPHLSPKLLQGGSTNRWLVANALGQTPLERLCEDRIDALAPDILRVVLQQTGVLPFLRFKDHQDQALLYQLMRQLDAGEDILCEEWLMETDFWTIRSRVGLYRYSNPLACAYSSPPKIEWAQLIAEGLIENRMIHHVDGIIANLRDLLLMGGSFAVVAVQLIVRGGVLVIHPAKGFPIRPLDASHVGLKGDGFQGHSHCCDRFVEYRHRSDDAWDWFTYDEDADRYVPVPVQMSQEGEILLQRGMHVCLEDAAEALGRQDGLSEAEFRSFPRKHCNYCGCTHGGKCGRITCIPSKAVPNDYTGSPACGYGDIQLYGEASQLRTYKLRADTRVGLVAPAWGKLLTESEDTNAVGVDHCAFLRGSTMTALKKQARQAGARDYEIANADDSVSPKLSMIKLIMKYKVSPDDEKLDIHNKPPAHQVAKFFEDELFAHDSIADQNMNAMRQRAEESQAQQTAWEKRRDELIRKRKSELLKLADKLKADQEQIEQAEDNVDPKGELCRLIMTIEQQEDVAANTCAKNGVINRCFTYLLQRATDFTGMASIPHRESVVNPAVIAFAGAALPGDDGLLGMLLQREFNGVIWKHGEMNDVKLFGSPAVKKLIEFKWERFGRREFYNDVGLHLTLTVAWQIVVLRDAETAGSFLPVWSGVPLASDYCKLGAAVLLTLIAGTSRLWKPYALIPKRESMVGPFPKRQLFSILEKAFTMLPAAVLMGAVEAPVNVVAMVVVITLSTRSLANELLELYMDGFESYLGYPEVIWNLCDAGSLVSIAFAVCRILSHQHRGLTTQIGVVATFLIWFRTIKHLSGMQKSAPYVQMFVQIVYDIRYFIVMLMIFWVASSFCLILLYPSALINEASDSHGGVENNRPAYELSTHDSQTVEQAVGTSGAASFASMNMMFFGQPDLDLINLALSPTLAKVIYVIFSLIVPVIMMNLLIALMGGSYENVEERGSEEGLRKRAELIVKYETLMTAADRHDDQLFPKWLHFFKPEDSPDDNDSDDLGVINGVKRVIAQGFQRSKAEVDEGFKTSRAQVDRLSTLLNHVATETNELSVKLEALQSQMDCSAVQNTHSQISRKQHELAAATDTEAEGVLIDGLMLEGCRWDDKIGALADAYPNELFAGIPLMLVKAVAIDKNLRYKDTHNDTYDCPVYKTRIRSKGGSGQPDGGYIFSAGLRTREPYGKWVMAGVALLADISHG